MGDCIVRQCESIKYTNSRGESLVIGCAADSELWWTDADGLDELKAEIHASGGIGQYGVTITSTRLPARTITLCFRIRKRESYWRSRLSHVFNPTLAGNLVYTDHDRNVSRYIECRVDGSPAVENAPWPEVQVELYAPYPLWLDGTGSQHVTDIALWLPGIWFPVEGFEIPDTGYEMGRRSPSLIVNVCNKGDVESGIRFVFKAQGSVRNPKIVNVETQEYLAVNLDMAAGDILTVTTGYDKMTAKLFHSGQTINVFSAVDADSTWLQLNVGDNLFRYAADEGEDNLNVSVYYDYAFMGARA